MKNWLVIMAKAPRLGAVKTRLGRDIGPVAATAFYRTQLAALTRRLGGDPRWRMILAVSPHDTIGTAVWPRGPLVLPQGRGDLGARMGRFFRLLPPGPVVIIGSDIPGIGSDHIARAFSRLGRADAVFGPAHDGGYWLIGLKRRPALPEVFGNVRWSSEHALADTLANLRGHEVALLDELVDVDTGADFERWRRAHRTGA